MRHWLPMARRPKLLRCLMLGSSLLASACVSIERPVISSETLPTHPTDADSEAGTDQPTEAGDGSNQKPDGEEPTTEEHVAGGPALALISPTGVVVPVISQNKDNYLVMTPCGNEDLLAWGTPLRSAQVVLDPGHGGEIETGAVGPNGLQEKDLNLAVSKRTARILLDRGISVVLTRTSDYRIPLVVRAMIANNLDADILVSVHHNAPNWLPSKTPGTEVFVQQGSAESQRLGGLIWEEMVEALSQFDGIEWTRADDAGALEVLNGAGDDTYGMVRRPEMPAVLAELGYISNPSEAELFSTDEYVEVASTALADAIERWLATTDSGSGFVAEPRLFTPSGKTGGINGCIDPALE